MIKHVVMWKLQDAVDGDAKKGYAKKLTEMLEALPDKIPQVKNLEVGININSSEFAADVILYSEFESREDLEAYQNHPDHMAVIPFVKAVSKERRIVDYEC